jgi:hypothetical protein
LETFDTSTQDFLDNLPTPEKYAILSMTLVLRGDYEDYEIAYDESMNRISAQELTRHMLAFQCLDCHLKDALQFKWSYFEQVWSNENEDEDD